MQFLLKTLRPKEWTLQTRINVNWIYRTIVEVYSHTRNALKVCKLIKKEYSHCPTAFHGMVLQYTVTVDCS